VDMLIGVEKGSARQVNSRKYKLEVTKVWL